MTTTAPVRLTDEQRRSIEADRFDVAEWDETVESMPMMTEAADELAAVNWTGKQLTADVFQALHKNRPHITDETVMAKQYAVNRKLVTELTESDAYRDLHLHTAGDPFASALATMSMRQRLAEMYGTLAPVQEAAEEAAKAEQEHRDALDEALSGDGDGDGGEGGEGAGVSAEMQESLDRMAERSAAAQAALDEALDQVAPTIGAAARGAAREAADDAERNAEAMAGWGLTPGDLVDMDPTERIALMRELDDERMADIAKLLGAMWTEARGERDNRWDAGPDQLHDITLGNDLPLVLPSEFVYLLDPDLEDYFYMKYATRKLLQQELWERVPENRGDIVYVEDSSSSMQGDPEVWARAVGMTFLRIAQSQGRGFTAIVFAGPGQIKTFHYPAGQKITADGMLAYARFAFMGGTAVEAPLDQAADQLHAQWAETGYTEGDVVFATDDLFKVAAEWAAAFKAKAVEAGFRVYGIAMGLALGDTSAMSDLCDGRVAPVTRLTDGSDIDTIFRGLA